MSQSPGRTTSPLDVGRHVLLALLWLCAYRLLSEHAVRLIPLSLARGLSLQAYLTAIQVVTAAVGLGMSLLLLPAPGRSLGLVARPSPGLAVLLLLGPGIYVIASYAAIYAALPTLLAELAARGRQGVQQSTGEFGRELAASGLGLAVIWGVLVSPVCEELMFRGATWSAAQSALDYLRQRAASAERAPASADLLQGVLEPSRGLAVMRAISSFFVSGGIATLVSAGIFAAMHADMPGGLGIVRWVSALGIGLAAGLARQATSGLLGPMVVHVVFNLCALATTRRWLVSESFGQKLGVPTLMSLTAAVSGVLALALAALLYLRTRRARSS